MNGAILSIFEFRVQSKAPHALTPEDRAKIQRLTGGK
jgi:hypothetical protein